MAELIDFPSTRGYVKTERMRVTTVSDMTRNRYPRRQNRDLAVLVVDSVGLWGSSLFVSPRRRRRRLSPLVCCCFWICIASIIAKRLNFLGGRARYLACSRFSASTELFLEENGHRFWIFRSEFGF